jgi:metal transporter CNNM
MSGLTLGLVALDINKLRTIMISGSDKYKICAKKVEPLCRHPYILLCTLLLINMLATEALPIVVNFLVEEEWEAIVLSTALVVIFCEIIPQSVCAKHGLVIGAFFAPFIRLLIILFYPICFPIAKLLEFILGKNHGTIYNRDGKNSRLMY